MQAMHWTSRLMRVAASTSKVVVPGQSLKGRDNIVARRPRRAKGNGLVATGGASSMQRQGPWACRAGGAGTCPFRTRTSTWRTQDRIHNKSSSGSAMLQTGDVQHEVGTAKIIGGDGHRARGGDIEIIGRVVCRCHGRWHNHRIWEFTAKSAGRYHHHRQRWHRCIDGRNIKLSSGNTAIDIEHNSAQLRTGLSTLKADNDKLRLTRNGGAMSSLKHLLTMAHGKSHLDLHNENMTLTAPSYHSSSKTVVEADLCSLMYQTFEYRRALIQYG